MKVYHKNKAIGVLESLIITDTYESSYPESENFKNAVQTIEIMFKTIDSDFVMKILEGKLNSAKFKIKNKIVSGEFASFDDGLWVSWPTIVLEKEIN